MSSVLYLTLLYRIKVFFFFVFVCFVLFCFFKRLPKGWLFDGRIKLFSGPKGTLESTTLNELAVADDVWARMPVDGLNYLPK